MNREEIEKRIKVCEERIMGYLEVGNSSIVKKYENEKYKWEKLLNDLDLLNERKINELLDYKKAYYEQQEVINTVRNNLEKDIAMIKTITMSKEEIIFRLEITDKMLKGGVNE